MPASTTVTDVHRHELSRAKIALMDRRDSAFFTTLCFSLKHIWDDSVPTAQTDGRSVQWNPSFFLDTLVDKEERVFVMCHEVMHPAFSHLDEVRMRGKDPDLWNIACDHVINLMLIARGFKQPTRIRCHADPRFTGMMVEEVYKILKSECGGGGNHGQKPAMADIKPAPAEDPKVLRRHVEDILVRASIVSKASKDKPGTIPGEIQIMLDRLLDPKLPWHQIVANWMHNFDKTDYSFKKANRRFWPQHHLPSLWGESLCDLAVAVDASSSVLDWQFSRFVGELAGLMRRFKPKKITLVIFNTGIVSVHEVRSVEELKRIEFNGRGGTAIQPVIDWANEHKPQAMLVFTDGEFRMPKVHTKTPTIWLIHDDASWVAPFGKAVHYALEPLP